jgi:hypothetical protein
MVEISLSGSGEGPGWETSRPTLQSPFGAAPPAAAAPTSPAGRSGPARAPRSQAERGLAMPRRMG